jgi:hypothetical protein
MAQTGRPDPEIFDGGPPHRLEKSLGLIRADQRRTGRRAMLVVLLVWAPLYIISAIESLVSGKNMLGSLLRDLTVVSRYLIVAPLFILAEEGTIFRLGQIARHFIDAGIVIPSERRRFDAILGQCRGWLNSAPVELLVVILAYFAVVFVTQAIPTQDIPLWHKASGGGEGYSWAGWWHALVSVPVGLILLLGWLWRIFIWGVFLVRVSRLNLHLIPAHPDLVGGMQFVGLSVRAFLPVGFAIAMSVAGGVAQRVLYGASFFSFVYVIAAVVVLNLFLFAGPLLVFMAELVEARRRGILAYSGLAGAVGNQLEKRWLDEQKSVDEAALDVPHFSAATDLYQLVSNVYQMKFFPIDIQDVIALIVVTLLPFLPALLFEMPIDEILADLIKVMF